MNNLSECYENGEGTFFDLVKSYEWCKKSAEFGNNHAQNRLALKFENGIGVQIDLKQSFFWYLKSAESGKVSSQLNVSIAFEDGRGTPIDLEKSLFWAEMAANKNNFSACLRVARFCKNGLGCEINLEKSYHFFLQATKSKDQRISRLAIKEVREFQKHGLTKLSHFHYERMYISLSYDHKRIGQFNDISIHFK
jgi:uncharacterized protein